MDFHILTTHARSGEDGTPLQLISAAQLEHYKAMALAYAELCCAVQVLGLMLPPLPTVEQAGSPTESQSLQPLA